MIQAIAKCSILLLLTGIAPELLARGDVPYVYVAHRGETRASRISIGVNPKAVYVGHAGRGAKFCSEADDHHCVESVVFSFHVPKMALESSVAWERGGIRYRVVNAQEMEIFGVKLHVQLIEGAKGNGRSQFYYSESNGLVAFVLHKERPGAPTYFLQSGAGFPLVHREGVRFIR